MKCTGIIFDLDGTLLDTLDDLSDSMNAALASLGFAGHTRDMYKIFVGDGVRNLAIRALPAHVGNDAATVDECLRCMRIEYEARWHNKTREYDGIGEMLKKCGSKELPLSVLSNKDDSFTKKIVEYYFPNVKFVVVQGALPDVPKKPDPAAALAIAGQMGLDPGMVLYVGDTDTDMKTAAGAGMVAVGALWGFRTGVELLASGAAVLVREPGEIVEMV